VTTTGIAVDGSVAPAMAPHRAGSAGLAVAAGANLGLRFLVELGAYASLGYGGASVPGPTAVRVLSAAVAPLIAVIVWSLFLAPKAPRPLGEPAAIALELVIFGAAAIALARSGSALLAGVFGAVAVFNMTLVRVLDGGRRHGPDAATPGTHS
jgi:hypothetical protein